MHRSILLRSSLFAAVALMAADSASAGSGIDLAESSRYRRIQPTEAVIVAGGDNHTAVASYAKAHEDTGGRMKTTFLHVICHMGRFVLAREIENGPKNTIGDTHAIDPNVPPEIQDHLDDLNSTGATAHPDDVKANGVPKGTAATVLPMAAPVSELDPAPVREPDLEKPSTMQQPMTDSDREAALQQNGQSIEGTRTGTEPGAQAPEQGQADETKPVTEPEKDVEF